MSKVKVSKARIIELAATHSKPEVAKELGITVTTLNKLVDGLNIVFKAKRNKYELVDDVETNDLESVSGVNPIIYHTVVGEMHEQEEVEQIDTATEVNNITNTSVPVVEEDVNF